MADPDRPGRKGVGGIRHPAMRPLWRRIAVTAACFGWAGLEAFWGNPGWFWLFTGIGAYTVYEFFLTFDPRDFGDTDGE